MSTMVGANGLPLTPDKWIEIFHSKPSMEHCYLLEKLSSGSFTDPSPSNELVDAAHIREGFRVIRLPARRIEFVLTNGSSRAWEDNNGKNYVIDSIPGRYVVEHGIRRVDDANPAECAQAAMRKADKYVQVEFRADLWEKCFCSYKADADPWTPAPGVEMKLIEKKDMQGRFFRIEVEAEKFACAFNDGADNWDSNMRSNYRVGHPGKYSVADGRVHYIEPADKDTDKPLSVVDISAAPNVTIPTANGPPVATRAVAQ